VIAEAQADVPADVTGAPALTLDDAQLGELELLLSGAFAPLRGFMGAADVAAVVERGTLADGTPWPVPVTLDVSPDAVPADARRVALTDPEGTPLAVLDIAERSEVRASRPARDRTEVRRTRLSGPVTGLREPEHGPFRRLMLHPAQARAELGDGPVLAYATRGPVHSRQIGQLRHMAGQLKARVLLLPLIAGPADVVTRPEALSGPCWPRPRACRRRRWSSRCRWPPGARTRAPGRRANWRSGRWSPGLTAPRT